jgi:hypothetical protein
MTAAVRIVLALLAVGAVVIVMLVTGWADDKAKPGSGGRVPVPTVSPTPR